MDQHSSPRGKTVLRLTIFYLVVLFNLFIPILRLSYAPANYLLFALAQFIPLHIIGHSAQLSGWRKYCGIVIGILFCLPAAPFGLGAVACGVYAVADGKDYSFEPRQSLYADRGKVAVYRTNGGATTSFGIVVRQECTVVPGLLLVRDLGSMYPASDVQLDVLNDYIEIRYAPYGDRQTAREMARLKSYCLY